MRFEPALNYVVLIPHVLRSVPSVHSISLRCTYSLSCLSSPSLRLTCTPSPYSYISYRCNTVHSISLRFHILTSRIGVTRTRTVSGTKWRTLIEIKVRTWFEAQAKRLTSAGSWEYLLAIELTWASVAPRKRCAFMKALTSVSLLYRREFRLCGQVISRLEVLHNRLAVKREEAGNTKVILNTISSQESGNVGSRLTFLRHRLDYQ